MNRLVTPLAVIAFVCAGFLAGTVGSLVAQNSPGGSFVPSNDYTVAGQWTWRTQTSPWIIEGATEDDFETTVTFGEPTADRTWTFSDITDTVTGIAATQTLTNKTLTSPTISAPTLSGSATGTYTLAGTPTITSPTITGPAVSDPVTTSEVVDATAATLSVTAATHGGRIITLNRAAGITVTLPDSTGTGNRYRFIVGTTVTSGAKAINVSAASEEFVGMAHQLADGGNTANHYEAASGSDVDSISLNGTTTCGIVGDYVEVVDIASNTWWVFVDCSATGTEATMFLTGQV